MYIHWGFPIGECTIPSGGAPIGDCKLPSRESPLGSVHSPEGWYPDIGEYPST